jgi:hypothetical protein
MGAGIAHVFAAAGCAVTVVEDGENAQRAALSRIAGALDRAAERGKLSGPANRCYGASRSPVHLLATRRPVIAPGCADRGQATEVGGQAGDRGRLCRACCDIDTAAVSVFHARAEPTNLQAPLLP